MHPLNRRRFVGTTAAGAVGSGLLGWELATGCGNRSQTDLQLASFRVDVTPPVGHSLCGGWIKPVEAVDDPLEAIGLVILGHGLPLVICAVDWTGLLNEAHWAWRVALAEAAGTTPDRVSVQCVHQHNAPFACLEAQRIVSEPGDLPDIVDVDFFETCLQRIRQAVSTSLLTPRPLTHIACAEAEVQQVASNRRILGSDGRVASQRGSSSRDPQHQQLPEGLIDPMLKTVAFYDGDTKLAACHYYACHPMSYYGDGRVSADFCGLARKLRQQAEPNCTHLYFNGCGGNIGAGKYNDGSPEMRPILTGRIHDAMQRSEALLIPSPIDRLDWITHDFVPPADTDRWDEQQLIETIRDSRRSVVNRNRPAYTLAFLRRSREQFPITLAGLHVNNISMLHLPAECFIEYQLHAQSAAPQRFVACAAYGDGGPWYIPTAEAFPQGGYAVSVAWCRPDIDAALREGIERLLSPAG